MKPLLRWMSMAALVGAAGCAAQATQMEPCPATGCASTPLPATPYYRALESLAVQDLQCPANELRYSVVPRTGDAIEGCGKKALYLPICKGPPPFPYDCHPSRARDWI
jgi:hypothetical protein